MSNHQKLLKTFQIKADMTPQVGGGINPKTIDFASINLERTASPKKRISRHAQI
jgi:hypothetical protein